MAFGIPRFRVRSLHRDCDRDMERFTMVQSAIEAALASTTREFNGLEKRVTDALQGAISVMDNSGDYGQRDPDDEEAICKFERAAMTGQRRLQNLREQRESYEKILMQISDLKPDRPS